MQEREFAYANQEVIFEALGNKNVITDDHLVAFRFQQELNASTEPIAMKARTASVMIDNLNRNCHHASQEVIVNGAVYTKEIDLKGLNFIGHDSVTIETEYLHTNEKIVEDMYALSHGYVAQYVPHTDSFTFYQVVSTQFYSIDVQEHGANVTQSGLAYVPIDTTAYVQLATDVLREIPNSSLLDVYTPDIIDAVDEVLQESTTNPSDLSSALQRLSKLDLEGLCDGIFSEHYREIRHHLGAYVSTLLDYKTMSPYFITHPTEAYITDEPEPIPIHEHTPCVPGYLVGIIADKAFRSFAVELAMPFSDDTIHGVRYRLNPSIELNPLQTVPSPTPTISHDEALQT